MKEKLYVFLVNRQVGIKERYLKFHISAHGLKKYLSWGYLLWLNFAYYILHMRFLGEKESARIYEEKDLDVKSPESDSLFREGITVETFVQCLLKYDIISFDIFDTLILRPFSEPTDLFWFIGERLGVMNFRELRICAEKEAREECFCQKGHYEVTLEEIWNRLAKTTGIDASEGMKLEKELEMAFCYANPFMQEVYQQLREQGKTIIIVSDMYLPSEFLADMLERNGYDGYANLFVSCEYGKNKANGELYHIVKEELSKIENDGSGKKIVHVGDNPHSDVTMAKRNGFDSCYYPNVNRHSRKYRSYDMSPIIGGAYRGVINNYLYSGVKKHSMEWEYGFIYGGLFVTGYCAFIHEYCKTHAVDRVLFLSRDGDILKRAYELMYPEENTAYAYWSRRVAVKLMSDIDRYDFFRRFLFHKVNQAINIKEILTAMELESLVDGLAGVIDGKELLTEKNVYLLRQYIEENWLLVQNAYKGEQKGASAYYEELLAGCHRAVAVDIGWAGSGAVSLNHLVQKKWNIPCEIIGLIAGTNSVYNEQADASETFLQSGKLVSYLYSSCLNRDLWKKHNPDRNYNVYWELLLSSPTPQLKGFEYDESIKKYTKIFGENDANQQGICDIQDGILTFVREYKRCFEKVPFMYNISGRDAYAPMLLAAGNEEKYLKKIERNFALNKNIS